MPTDRVNPVDTLIEGIMDLIKKNLITKANLSANAFIGDTNLTVDNSYNFEPDQEIIIIDNGYSDESSSHYDMFEYARIRAINNTNSVTLYDSTEGEWLVSNNAFIQKTIGHSPLYEDNVYYGDREVIPTNEMAITVENKSISNDWIYIQGGLENEFRVIIMVYGKDIDTEEGLKILNKYTDAVRFLMNGNIHLDVNDYHTPILYDVSEGATEVRVENNATNREEFDPAGEACCLNFMIQDNNGVDACFDILSLTEDGAELVITLGTPLNNSYSTDDFAIITHKGRYFYDSRVDQAEYGVTQKGSAVLRAAELSWFGKEVEELSFPRPSLRVDAFPKA